LADIKLSLKTCSSTKITPLSSLSKNSKQFRGVEKNILLPIIGLECYRIVALLFFLPLKRNSLLTND